ncbi:hypothetical protein A5664_00790 [Mycolicibacterium fortuitum]|uniref:hypothetical protein n=1 Tax=Mycolicibacterium fortuitum TaxID=1766 RepID=UPI0007EC2C39|nr:hypothetical protein [Mycolicibacterium fortuitum]OBB08700.1 hypothetical protein A5668_12415 [Mycolicibacterium fortuitum]OBI69733.1 hypothetical protein A5664_00790 [Mycolicibacterium fortuitum]
MTQPPNGWGNQPLPPPPENGWQGQQPGQQPPVQSPPSWGPQHQQQFTPPPPPKNNRALKWALGGTALIAVIAITAVVTMSLGGGDKEKGDGSGPTPTAGSGSNSEFASANDTGPITIITEDPSCAAWTPIINTMIDSSHGWAERDPSIPASVWSPDLRALYQRAGSALEAAADQTVPLVKLTPHRVMREVYEQFIAYARAFADRIPTYAPSDNALDLTARTATNIVTRVCQAITSGSAAARAPLVQAGDPPSQVAAVGDPANPERFLTSPNDVCREWQSAAAQFLTDIDAWRHTDSNVPAGQWGPEQRALSDQIAPILKTSADTMVQLGGRSGNPIWNDFAELAAQYRRAYAQALPTYTQADVNLYYVGLYPAGVIRGACDAAAG